MVKVQYCDSNCLFLEFDLFPYTTSHAGQLLKLENQCTTHCVHTVTGTGKKCFNPSQPFVLKKLILTELRRQKLFIFGFGSTFVHNFGSGSGSSSCHTEYCHLKLYCTVLQQQYHKKYVSMEVFLYPSILQTHCS